jgi:TetR/AcrR family transcriptional repressor of nem operon
VNSQGSENSSDRILAAATQIAQARGYGGLNVRALAEQVGIKAASLYHHFPSKAALAAAVARRYWQDAQARLNTLAAGSQDPRERLRRYPQTFRIALENDNRMCLCSFMAAEYDDLPGEVQDEVRTFSEVNIDWLTEQLVQADFVRPEHARARAESIFAAVAGAQLMARGRADIAFYDASIASYQAAGLLPA